MVWRKLLLLVHASWAAGAAAQGDLVEPWCDYRTPAGVVYEGKSLTLEQVRDLGAPYAVLTLLNVTEISEEVAGSVVSRNPDTFLTLPALETVDVATAAKLSGHRGHLRLWGIKSLTPEVAAALVGSYGLGLQATGVRQISPEVARALANGKREEISLGLTSLPAETAAILAEFPGELCFPRLETLSLEAASALGKHRGELDLGPADIKPDVAEVLLRHDAPLELWGVKKLAPGVGDILAQHKAQVRLALEEIDSLPLARKLFSEPYRSASVANLRTMSPEIAAEYARHDPGYLKCLDTLSVEVAREIAKGDLEIDLPAVIKLSPELATALTTRTRPVYLSGIKVLEGPEAVPVAEALASTPAPIWMTSLERVSAAALTALRKKDIITLPPDDKLTIVP